MEGSPAGVGVPQDQSRSDLQAARPVKVRIIGPEGKLCYRPAWTHTCSGTGPTPRQSQSQTAECCSAEARRALKSLRFPARGLSQGDHRSWRQSGAGCLLAATGPLHQHSQGTLWPQAGKQGQAWTCCTGYRRQGELLHPVCARAPAAPCGLRSWGAAADTLTGPSSSLTPAVPQSSAEE